MTITVHDARTGEDLNARELSREVARRDDPACHLCGCHGWTPDAPLPDEVSEPHCLHVIADRSGKGKRAYPKDNWQDVSHATAMAFGRRWADLHDMAAEFRAWVDSLPGVPQVEWAELPPDPARQLAPEALDAEYAEYAENSHDGLARIAERRGVDLEEFQSTYEQHFARRPWWRRPFAAVADALERAETRRQERMHG